MRRSSLIQLTALLVSAGLLSACNLFGGDGTTPAACSDGTVTTTVSGSFQESDTAAARVIQDVPANVIYPTYLDLTVKAAALQQAVTQLGDSVTGANLLAAQAAWRAARRPWEQSEAFLFGPVETQGIDPHIDSWPLDKNQLDAVLNSSDVLTKAYIDSKEESLKGFHAIEYLLFDTNATKQASQITPRQLQYLQALTASFAASVDSLEQAWNPSKGNFEGTFQTAGTGNAAYSSKSAAIQELLNAMADICNEVANSKISDPFDQKDRTKEESQFSNNSDSDFSDNIRSVRNVYVGGYGSHAGKGLQYLLQQKDSTLANQVLAQTDSAIAAILDMKPTFGSAIFNAPDKVESARCAVQTLHATLVGPVKKALGL